MTIPSLPPVRLRQRILEVARVPAEPSVLELARLADAIHWSRCPRCETGGMTWALVSPGEVDIRCACGWHVRVRVDAGAAPLTDPPLPP